VDVAAAPDRRKAVAAPISSCAPPAAATRLAAEWLGQDARGSLSRLELDAGVIASPPFVFTHVASRRQTRAHGGRPIRRGTEQGGAQRAIGQRRVPSWRIFSAARGGGSDREMRSSSYAGLGW
jgi:hypothetical protein